MSEDNGRSDDYWMGVRDALRMVDSFLNWSRKNQSRAKSLDDFIHDGLIAAARRCESCLSEKLGLKFQEEEEEEFHEETRMEDFEMASKSMTESAVETLSDSSFEYSAAGTEESVQEDPERPEGDITVDDVERITDESMSEYDVEGPPRDFSSDFELVEPTPLRVQDDEEDDEEVNGSVTTEEAPMEEDDEESDSGVSPFTWSEYEEAVSPSEEDLPDEEDEDSGFSLDEPEEPSTLYDELSIPEEEETSNLEVQPLSSESLLDMEEEADDEGEAPITGPPPPPPPPESDEDEEERKRRARRLFFGT